MADKPLQSLTIQGLSDTYVNTPLSTAPIFDNTIAYAVGDYVFYNRKLYKFTSAHMAGEWNSNDVVEITIGDELKNKINIPNTVAEKTAICEMLGAVDESTFNTLDLEVNGELIQDVEIPTVTGYTLDSTFGTVREGGTRRIVTEFIPIEEVESVTIVCTDANHSSRYDQGYWIFEYSEPIDDASVFLGVHDTGSWYWTDTNATITTNKLQFNGKYIRLCFMSTLEVTVTEHYNNKFVGGLKQRTTALETDSLIKESRIDKLETSIDKYVGKVLNIAYSYIYLAPPNTLEHFITACILGFDAIKCDLQLTSDNKLICCHDAGFTLDSNNKIIDYDSSNNTLINTLTEAQCLALKYAQAPYDMGHEASPATLDGFLEACKQYNKIPFITIRDANVIEALFASLDKYNMRGAAIINCLNSISTLQVVRNTDSSIYLNHVLTKDTILTNEIVDQCVALKRCSISLFTANGDSGNSAYTSSANAIAYAKSLGILIQDAQVQNMDKYLSRVRDGIDGLQLIRAFLPYEDLQFSFKIVKSGNSFSINGIFKWTTPYTATITSSNSEITISDIYLNGSTRTFADGIMPLWLNIMPYNLIVKSESGQNANITWSNNAFHLVADDITIDDTYIITVALGENASNKDINDIQVNSTSILSNGIANIPIATLSAPGVVMVDEGNGISISDSSHKLCINYARDAQVKAGTNSYCPITPAKQDKSVFYGLAKAAGDTTQSASSNEVGTYTDDAKSAIQNMLDVPSNDDVVTDVQVNGTSVLGQDGVANVPIMTSLTEGIAKLGNGLTINSSNQLTINKALDASIKSGANEYLPIVPVKQHISVFYGLAKAAGDTTQSASDNAVGTYTDEAKTAIQTMLDVPSNSDLTDYVKNTDYATSEKAGIIKASSTFGVQVQSGTYADYLRTYPASPENIKDANSSNDCTYRPITPVRQHHSVFYGLAKAAGDSTQAASSNTVGNYTDDAKAAIKAMLGVTDSTQTIAVSGTTPTITALANARYICGEVSTLTITPPGAGICEVVFTSGSTPTVLTATGVTFPDWFDSTGLEADTTYEISISDGRGVVALWAS